MSKLAKRMQWLLVLGMGWLGTVGESDVAVALEVGERAPDFSLPSTTGEKITLSQFRGKQPVLLEFYGKDFAPTCGANLSARKGDYSKFQALSIQILGMSTDHPFSQKTFAESLQLPFPLLSDFPDLKVTRQYGGLSLNATLSQSGSPSEPSFLSIRKGSSGSGGSSRAGKRLFSPLNRSCRRRRR